MVLGVWKLLSPLVPLPESTPQMQSPMFAAEAPPPDFHLTLSSFITALMDDMLLHPIQPVSGVGGQASIHSDHYSILCIMETWYGGDHGLTL